MEPQQTNPTPEILPTESSKMRTKKYFYIIICLLIFAVVYIFSNLYVANNREPAFVPHFDEKTNCYWQDVDLRTCGVSDTYNWKTYKNEEYGFEFKYPPSLVYNSNEQGIYFENPQVDYVKKELPVSITVSFEDKNYENVDQWFTLDKYKDENYNSIMSRKLLIGGVNALELNDLEGSPIGVYEYYFIKDHILYKIALVNDKNTNEKILSTFKFIDKAVISNWKTYKDEKYGFEFKYPGDWVKIDNYQTDPDLITIVSSREAAERKCHEGCGPDLWFYIHKNTNIDNYIKDPGNLVYNPKKITIDNHIAYEAVEGGYSSYYVILIQNEKDLYEIFAYNNELNLSSDTVESQILRTFKFTK